MKPWDEAEEKAKAKKTQEIKDRLVERHENVIDQEIKNRLVEKREESIADLYIEIKELAINAKDDNQRLMARYLLALWDNSWSRSDNQDNIPMEIRYRLDKLFFSLQ